MPKKTQASYSDFLATVHEKCQVAQARQITILRELPQLL